MHTSRQTAASLSRQVLRGCARLFLMVTTVGLIQLLPSTVLRANLFVSESSSAISSDAILRFAPNGTRSTFASGLSIARGLAFDSSGQLRANRRQ
jgi:hypothetical protein